MHGDASPRRCALLADFTSASIARDQRRVYVDQCQNIEAQLSRAALEPTFKPVGVRRFYGDFLGISFSIN
jgi:hypothetical protein